jgi:hypothetical protein
MPGKPGKFLKSGLVPPTLDAAFRLAVEVVATISAVFAHYFTPAVRRTTKTKIAVVW